MLGWCIAISIHHFLYLTTRRRRSQCRLLNDSHKKWQGKGYVDSLGSAPTKYDLPPASVFSEILLKIPSNAFIQATEIYWTTGGIGENSGTPILTYLQDDKLSLFSTWQSFRYMKIVIILTLSLLEAKHSKLPQLFLGLLIFKFISVKNILHKTKKSQPFKITRIKKSRWHCQNTSFHRTTGEARRSLIESV